MTRAYLVLAAISPAPAAAQQGPAAPATTGSTVVVTGRRAPPEKEVRRLTRAVTVPQGEQIARFPDAVCPVSVGMPLDYDERVARRIRADAAAAGVRVAPPGCRPNVTVLVVENGQAIVREIKRSRAWMFAGLDSGRVDRMLADPGPVHAWTATEIRSRDGDRERIGTMREDVPELQVRDASILHLPTRQDINAAVLLIDVDAVIGKTINQIADYAAMRTLAQTRPAAGGDDTILALFDRAAGDKPRGLTGFDAGYLRSLYAGAATDSALAKRERMTRAISRGSASDGHAR